MVSVPHMVVRGSKISAAINVIGVQIAGNIGIKIREAIDGMVLVVRVNKATKGGSIKRVPIEATNHQLLIIKTKGLSVRFFERVTQVEAAFA